MLSKQIQLKLMSIDEFVLRQISLVLLKYKCQSSRYNILSALYYTVVKLPRIHLCSKLIYPCWVQMHLDFYFLLRFRFRSRIWSRSCEKTYIYKIYIFLVYKRLFCFQPRQITAIGGLPRPGYPTASPIIQRTRHPIGVRNPVSSSSMTNFNAQTLIRTPSGLSIQKATVMTG